VLVARAGAGDRRVDLLAAGDSHSCTVVEGRLYCWGSNDFGKIGTPGLPTSGPAMVRRAAVQVPIPSGPVTALALGHSHTCAVVGGDVICWGSNQFGQCGVATTELETRPAKVEGLGGKPSIVAVSYDYSCAVVDGAAKCWGRRVGGEPTTLEGLERSVTAIGTGDYHLCAVVEGAVRCMSLSGSGKPPMVVHVDPLEGPVSAVGVGGSQACALSAGRVSCWELGDATFKAPPPRVIAGIPPGATALSVGSTHACALAEGSVWCWGSDDAGQVGASRSGDEVAHRVPSLGAVVRIATGASHTCAADARGVWCWGADRFGQLGSEPHDTCKESLGNKTPETDEYACGRVPALVVGLP
jgi:alpha-tubulin suppressor-like RCC1 family protein